MGEEYLIETMANRRQIWKYEKNMNHILLTAITILFASQLSFGEPVSLNSLLSEMLDRSQIAEFPQIEFECRQASSYDRRSVIPGNAAWFYNNDWSNFERCEEVENRREWVLMDANGPGAIVRWWITGYKFNGMIRVYLDGSDKPVLEGKADQLIGGDLFLGEPLNAVRSKGRNLYLPIPYSRSCKITYDGPNTSETNDFDDNFYYAINYRRYAEGTTVKTFSMEDFEANKDLISKVQRDLLMPQANYLTPSRSIGGDQKVLKTHEYIEKAFTGPGAISRLRVRIRSENLSQAMRSTVITAAFDGRQTVWVPVGEFFGTGLGLNPYKGWWRQVEDDGWMNCYWPMPFKNDAKVTITNYGRSDVSVEVDDIEIADWQWTDRTMYFHSAWRGQNDISVIGADRNRMEDWNYITVNGKGVYAGDTLTVFNRINRWWGEGDEKIFVDGETFPSHFGTGSEDYFGYAWGLSEYFTAPFHAQPIGTGNDSVNHTTNTRIRVLDKIPFNRSIKFDMELWHWLTTTIDYATTTYWYAFDGAEHNGERSIDTITEKVGRILLSIEGETAQLRRVSGGYTEVQTGQWGLSEGKQLWWRNGSTGDVLELAVPVNMAGRYAVVAQMSTACDYGRFGVRLNDKELSSSQDFYGSDGVWLKKIELGTLWLDSGEHILSFTILDRNPDAKPGNMLGIDTIVLNKVD